MEITDLNIFITNFTHCLEHERKLFTFVLKQNKLAVTKC